MLNQARLKVLKVREDHVRNVLDEARKRLQSVSNNPTQYAEIVKLLCLQGLYRVSLELSRPSPLHYLFCIADF